MRIEHDGNEPLQVWLSSKLPPAARIVKFLVNGKAERFEPELAYFADSITGHVELVTEYEGGIGIVPTKVRPEPGDRATSLRILRTSLEDEEKPRMFEISLAGLGGRTYTLDLVTTEPKLTAEGATVKKTENGYRLEISFEGPENEYVTRQIRLRW
jgi:hypothetical protein